MTESELIRDVFAALARPLWGKDVHVFLFAFGWTSAKACAARRKGGGYYILADSRLRALDLLYSLLHEAGHIICHSADLALWDDADLRAARAAYSGADTAQAKSYREISAARRGTEKRKAQERAADAFADQYLPSVWLGILAAVAAVKTTLEVQREKSN